MYFKTKVIFLNLSQTNIAFSRVFCQTFINEVSFASYTFAQIYFLGESNIKNNKLYWLDGEEHDIFLLMFGGLVSMDEIKNGLKEGKLILGTKRTVKSIRAGGVSKIFLAKNCPDVIAEDIEHYCAITQTTVERLDVDCAELGIMCKKPFYISVVAIAKV